MTIVNRFLVAAVAVLAAGTIPSLGLAAEGEVAAEEICNPVVDSAGDPVLSVGGSKPVLHEGSFACPQPEPVAAEPPPPPAPITISADVLFAFDRSDIRPEFYPELDAIAEELRQRSDQLTIVGHTDSIGTERYNQGLSERRAQAVVDYLTARGVPRSRLTAMGVGESQPVASNESPEGRAQNRRVEIVSAA